MTVPPGPKVHTRKYTVTSPRCAWGKLGEEIELSLTDNQELSLLQAGTVKRVENEPTKAAVTKKR